MLRRILLIVNILLLCAKFGYSQDAALQLTNPFSASPQVASIGKYGEIPVSMNSGVPGINIPLFNIESGDINLPITLSYHAGGIKVEEIASNVGLGWNLSSVGVVSRQIRGLADDLAFGYNSTGYWTEAYLNNQLDAAGLQTYLTGIRTGIIDSEKDIYSFNTPGGISGKFFLDKNGNYVVMPKANIRIEKLSGTLGWKVTDDQGIQYFFTQEEHTTTENETRVSGVPQGSSISFSGISSWFIKEIIDSKGNKVTFSYEYNRTIYATKASETRKFLTTPLTSSSCQSVIKTSSTLINTIDNPKINQITWDGGQLTFTYNTQSRLDLENDKALSIISKTDKQGNTRTFQFYTSYFYDGGSYPTDPTLAYRLKLDSLKEISANGSSLPPHRFEYNSLILPDRLSNSQDYWGYYNAKNNTEFVTYYQYDMYGNIQTLGANKEINPVATQANILKKIYYPMGGSTSFDYENNQYHVSQAGTASYETNIAVLYGENSGGFEGQTLWEYSQPFTITQGNVLNNQAARVKVQLEQGGCQPSSYCYIVAELYYPDGHFITLNNNQIIDDLQPGNYILKGWIETDELNTSSLYISSSLLIGTWLPAGYIEKYSGGLRVKKITNDDGTQISGIKEYSYNTFNANISSGSIGNNNNLPAYNRSEVEYSYRLLFEGTPNQHWEQDVCPYNVNSSASNYPLLTANGTYTTYENVTVVEKSLSGVINGKSEYFYTTFDSHPDLSNSYDVFPFPPSCSFDWKRGLPLREKHYSYSNSFTLLQEKANNYNFVPFVNSSGSEITGVKIGSYENYNGYWGGQTPDHVINAGLLLRNYATASEVFYLQSDTTTVYDPLTSNKLISINTYNYNEIPTLLKSQITTTSKGDLRKIVNKYPSDYANSGFVANLISANCLRFPLEVYKSKVNTLGEEKVTDGYITSYKPGTTLKDAVYTFQNISPISISQYQPSSIDGGGNLIMDSKYNKLIEFNQYDQFGNILEQRKAHGSKEVIIWGYNNQYPVAKIVGSDYNTAIQLVNLNILNNSNTSDVQMRQELDKLRSGLPAAQVTTYTHKPLAGISSMTDAKGQTTYYEYDTFQRLKTIRDQNQNILKSYDYHYKP